MIYLELIWAFFQIGLFSVGGGYAAMPLIQAQVVEKHGWLTLTQFGDIMAISEMTPGPIAINAATFVGIQTAGIPGALVATLGSVLPSCIIVLTLAWVYYKYRNLQFVQGVLQGLRPGVVALIASAGITLLFMAISPDGALPQAWNQVRWQGIVIFVLGFFVLRKWKCSPIWIIAGSGAAGMLLYGLF